jgi:hypothetical protein
VAEHGHGEPGAEHVGVVDAVTADHQRVQQGEHLAARPVGTRTVAKVDQLIDGGLDPQPLTNVAGSSPALATPWPKQLSSWSGSGCGRMPSRKCLLTCEPGTRLGDGHLRCTGPILKGESPCHAAMGSR